MGRLFLAEDEQLLFIDVGTAWLQVTTDTLPWDSISDKPKVFPPATHNHDALYEPKDGNIQEHIKDKLSNPHNVTKAQVGLGNVDNTSDLDKPISTAVQQALDTKVDNSRVLTDVPEGALFTDTIYVHPETHPASMIEGLATVATSGNYSDLKGVPEEFPPEEHSHPDLEQALATKVDSSRVLTDVPANAKFTDTIYTHPETHPASMITGLANVATSGDYRDLLNKPTALPPGPHDHDDLYEPKNANIQAHIASKTGNPHNVTKAQIGLGNVDNTADKDKPISTAVQQALDGKVDKVEGKGLSTRDFLPEYEEKLVGIEPEANKYIHPETHPASMITGLAAVATSGKYSDLTGKPSLLALGTTSTTAYRGDHGLIAYNHSQAPHAPSNAEPNRPIATQAQAEEGTNNTTVMTPLRVRQAIEAYTGVIDGGTFK